MITENLFSIVTYLMATVGFYLLAGYLAFRGNAPVLGESLKLMKEPTSKLGVLKQIIIVAIFFTVVLSVIFLSIKSGISFRKVMFVVGWGIIFGFSNNFVSRRNYRPTVKIAISFIAFIVATFISYLWYVYPNWLTIDSTALLFGLFILISLKDLPPKQVLILTTAIMIYDVVAVFGTETIQKVATETLKDGPIPNLLIVPRSLAIESKGLFMIGLGDIVFPGLIVMMAMRKARTYALPLLSIGTIIGYIASSLILLTALFIYQRPQPATIYLIPGVVVGFFTTAWYYGLVKEILSAKDGVS